MIIWGWRTTVRHLANVVFMCSRSGQPAGYQVLKHVTKFTLFFIPLFPIGVKYTLECTACGESRKIGKEEALAMVAQQDAPQQQGYPQAPQQGYPQAAPSQGHPQQPYPAQGQYQQR